MIGLFILRGWLMARRTVFLPDGVDRLVRDALEEGESYSAAVARLIEAGIRAEGRRGPPRYVGSGDGPKDLGRLAERYLASLARSR